MNRRAILAGLAAIPPTIFARPARALSPSLSAEWREMAEVWAVGQPRAAPAVWAAVRLAHATGFRPSELTAICCGTPAQCDTLARPFSLHFGDWERGDYVTVEPGRVLRWIAEGPAERWI